MTVLLTGGTGFLGSHVAEQLCQAGRQVRALVRRTSNTEFLQTLEHVEMVEGAVDDPASLPPALDGVEAIVHAAGLVKARSAEEFHRVNAAGTRNLLEAAQPAGGSLRRFVLVSSIAAVGPSDAAGTPVRSDAPPRPVTAYGRSKLAAERMALEYRDQLPITILRPPGIYGPRDREMLTLFKAANLRVLPYLGSPETRMSIVYGADAGAACIAAIDAQVPSGQSYFISDGRVYTLGDLAQAAEVALGKRALVRFPIPQRLLRAAAGLVEAYGKAADRAVMFTPDKCHELFAQWVCDSSDAEQALGWKPRVEFAEGARITAEWYRRAGWL